MLLRARNEARGLERIRIAVLGSREHNFFTNGAFELFDCAAQGRIDAFFLGGGQIDGQANINLVGTGDYPRSDVRWPGCFGSAFLYFLVPRVILFREEHSPRVLVDKVDYVSAPGTSPPRNPNRRAIASSWILFSEAVAVLRAFTSYAAIAALMDQSASATPPPARCAGFPQIADRFPQVPA